MMAQDWGEFRGILLCDFCDRAKENREANGEDALFAAGENAAAKIEGAECGFFDGCCTEIVNDEDDLFGFFRGRGDGFAEFAEAEHARHPYPTAKSATFRATTLA